MVYTKKYVCASPILLLGIRRNRLVAIFHPYEQLKIPDKYIYEWVKDDLKNVYVK
jgi:hypothetical protein